MSNKQYAVISCPIFTMSGYGARSYDLLKAIYELKKDVWDIEVIPQRWGATTWVDCEADLDKWGWILPLVNKTGQLKKQPDIWMQCTVPNEFQAVGKYNIGFTAGIETTICAPQWIDGINRMQLTLVSSEHSKKVLQESSFEEKNQQGQLIRHIKTEKPVEVLFEGLDLEKYFYIADSILATAPKTELIKSLDSIKESFCYLFVGHWLQGDIGEDRKNVGLTIHTFLDTFKDKKNKPALVLKTSSGAASIMDRDHILQKIDSIRKQFSSKNLPNIYLIHGELDDADINQLYNHSKIKAMISLTKGEGFGRPLLEFTAAKKPLIASYWSGQIDFLNPEYYVAIPGELKQIHPSAAVKDMLIPESAWFSPNIPAVKKALEEVYTNYSAYEEKAKRQARKTNTEFSLDKMKDKLNGYFEFVPKQIELVLPKLKKIELPKLTKIK